MRLLKFYSLILVLFFNFFCTKALKKPEWTTATLPDNHYKGISINRPTEEEALKDARNNAIKKIMEEIGISLVSEFERKRSEDAEGVNVEFKDNLRGKTKGQLKGIKERNYFTMKSKNGVGYDAWVLISIPPGEIKRSRDKLKEFEYRTVKEANMNFAMAEELEKKSDFENATIYYNSVLKILEEIETPEAKNLKIKALEKIKRIDNVSVRFMQLVGNTDIIKDSRLVYCQNKTPAPVLLKIGDKILLKTELKKEAYVYIISWDRETEEFRLLFPNKFFRGDNFFSAGELLFPITEEEQSKICLEAEPPAGWNYLKVIACSKAQEIPPFREKPYLSLTKTFLFDFISNLNEVSFDAEEVQFGIE